MAERIAIRAARPEEAAELTELCMRSKALWGYDAAFMEVVREQLILTPDYIRTNPVFVADRQGATVGVYALSEEGDFVDLDFLFVEPDHVRTGVGEALWPHILEQAKRFGHARLRIIADPSAVPFYERMGAVRCGEEPNALIRGRLLPVLEVRF